MAFFSGFWAIILPTVGGLGRGLEVIGFRGLRVEGLAV